MKKLNWEISTSKDRTEAIELLKNLISNSDAAILNFNFYSDLAISLMIEIEEKQIPELHAVIQGCMNVSELSMSLNVKSNREWYIFINMTFASGRGKMSHDRPNVPG